MHAHVHVMFVTPAPPPRGPSRGRGCTPGRRRRPAPPARAPAPQRGGGGPRPQIRPQIPLNPAQIHQSPQIHHKFIPNPPKSTPNPFQIHPNPPKSIQIRPKSTPNPPKKQGFCSRGPQKIDSWTKLVLTIFPITIFLSSSFLHRFWTDFGIRIGPKMEPKSNPKSTKNRCQLRKAIFEKPCSHCSGVSIFDFLGFGCRSWDLKSFNNRIKTDVNFRRHLGIEFLWILLDLGRQVGRENGSKRDPKSMQKYIKNDGTKICAS